MISLLEIEQVEARFIREFGIKNLSYLIDIDTWARDGIHDMRIPNFYHVKDKEIKIQKGSAPLIGITDLFVAAYYYKDNSTPFELDNSFELLIRNDNNFGTQGLRSKGSMYATINSGRIHVQPETGFVRVFYKDVPTDCNGKTLIPNNPKVIKALMYYFIYRMGLSGYAHPVISWDIAMQLWEKEYPAAGNDASWFTEAELQAFTELWTNPLIGDLHRDNYIY